MAYMNAERKKIIAENLKPVLKKYGMKGSLSVRNHMAISLTLQSGPIDFGSDIRDINPYWFHEHYEGVAKDFLTEAFAALKTAGYYDNSDASIDYFDTAYYYGIVVGKWNKPYICTSKVRETA
jgi:hypothetical protein